MRNGLKKLIIAGAVILLAAAAAWYVHYETVGRYQQSTNDARIEADQITVSSKLAGYVTAVAARDNQSVAQGALLVQIDPADYRTRVFAADAAIASSVAGIEAARAGMAESRSGIAAAQAAVASARADLAHAAREVERYRPLVAQGAEPATRLSDFTAQRDRATAALAAAEAALDQSRRRMGSAAAQVALQTAQADAARVQQANAASDLALTRVVSPVAGKVANRTVRVGQFVQPGMRLMTIVPTDDIYVVANFKETRVGMMRPGQPATIHVDALPGIAFKGVITSVTPGTGANFSLIPPQNATGNFTKIVQRVPVRIRIEAGAAARRVLVPGLSLEVEVDTRAGRKELDAIRDEQSARGP